MIKSFVSKKTNVIFLAGGGSTSAMKNFSAYSLAKTSIVRLCENLSVEYENKYKFYCISPGAIKTKLLSNAIKHGDKVFIERYTVENPKTKKTPDDFYEDMTNVKKHAQVTQKIKDRNKSLSRNKNQKKRFDRTIKAYQKMRRRGKGRNGGYKNKKTRRKN